ncbi:MarR family winged helix-turn-helix transcriptional regulator [Heyndrickxia sp. NPDC080065]|uniref:MarR family winged helix-turn-helix transcriptional regulator n=1 Tax=Heyndrickxia sp. NPDC080065 TaxID=3390568 RepID=UPI003D0315CE
MRKIFQKVASANNLSIPQFAVLMTIAPHKEMTQKQLGLVTHFPKSTLSQAVDGLVQAEMINRHPVEENRREMQLTLSEKGKKLHQIIQQQEGGFHHIFTSAVNKLSENQRNELLASLKHIAMFLEKEALEQGE